MPAFGTSIGWLGRAAGFLIVAGMIVAATIHMRRRVASPSGQEPNIAKQDDPLPAELKRCQQIGMAAATDAACESAWAALADGAKPFLMIFRLAQASLF